MYCGIGTTIAIPIYKVLPYLVIGGGIQLGAPVSMRTHKVGGAMRSCTLAQSVIIESYPVSSPQNTMSTCIILQTGGGVY